MRLLVLFSASKKVMAYNAPWSRRVHPPLAHGMARASELLKASKSYDS